MQTFGIIPPISQGDTLPPEDFTFNYEEVKLVGIHVHYGSTDNITLKRGTF